MPTLLILLLNVSHMGYWESFSCLLFPFDILHFFVYGCIFEYFIVLWHYWHYKCSRLLNIFRPSSRIRQFSKISYFVIYKDLLKLENGIRHQDLDTTYVCYYWVSFLNSFRSADRAKKDVCVLTHVYIYIYQWIFLHVKPFLTILR